MLVSKESVSVLNLLVSRGRDQKFRPAFRVPSLRLPLHLVKAFGSGTIILWIDVLHASLLCCFVYQR